MAAIKRRRDGRPARQAAGRVVPRLRHGATGKIRHAEAWTRGHGTTFLEYATRAKAVAAFETLTADCADGDIGYVMTGRITFVSLPCNQDDGHDVATWNLDDRLSG